ncbi:glyoxalase/bleomycin resistance/dioxygenase family protein [Herbidospora sp. NEAU-GS84]|uniref:Glyoxalase/bleomycin resistance/dioxygenase family protein n=1 Tax=Herbidospora solisilvae TaxID=2696284 RepID=A0A7C9NSV1_9ACTN|nr:VOC family protein [Herbidospora solisilvae]NAS26876.1 glyoxalase/bleomycin resistance/dioxygenase family protein [Herbidospora solisilvae]
MAHRSRLHAVSIDVPPDVHDRELAFWQGAVGREMPRLSAFPDFHRTTPPGAGISFIMQRLGEGAPGVHVDIHTDDLDAEVARLEGLGAVRETFTDNGWWIMRDPAGLRFCVLEDPPGTFGDDDSTLWE